MCRLSRNPGASTSWNPQGLSRHVVGKLYLFYLSWDSKFKVPKLRDSNFKVPKLRDSETVVLKFKHKMIMS
jgi:hypothetical protein